MTHKVNRNNLRPRWLVRLEDEADAELNKPWIAGTRDHVGCSGRSRREDARARIIKIGMVERIESIGPDVEPLSFGERKILAAAEVQGP